MAVVKLLSARGQPNILQLTNVTIKGTNPLVAYSPTIGKGGPATVLLTALVTDVAGAAILETAAMTPGVYDPNNPGSPIATAGAWFVELSPEAFPLPVFGLGSSPHGYCRVFLMDSSDAAAPDGFVAAEYEFVPS